MTALSFLGTVRVVLAQPNRPAHAQDNVFPINFISMRNTNRSITWLISVAGFFLAFHGVVIPNSIQAQDAATEDVSADEIAGGVAPGGDAESPKVGVAEQIDVAPVNSDDHIADRIEEILQATGWFGSPEVRVDRGVVFLNGVADNQKHQEWAESTAMRTSDVVAVVNRIKVAERSMWNFAPAIASLKELGRDTTSLLPLVVVAILITVLSYFLAKVTARLSGHLASRRVENTLLRQVIANVFAVIVFIIGFYIALRVSGLTRLAVTLLGGTGLVGLALGFAFRDIAENYLSSILISINHPFRVGDLIEVEGSMGFVRKVTTRGTVLNTLEGNQIQIPNSTVYKSQILNYTATPLLRLMFSVGIGFDDSISDAQELIMQTLQKHEAVMKDPAPLVLVDALGAATVNLKGFYWIDQSTHSGLKVGSSVIRQVKETLSEANISMPDEARELVFPHGVPVRMIEDSGASTSESAKTAPPKPPAALNRSKDQTSTEGEGNLSNEQNEIMRVTDGDATIASGTNLIE